MDNIINMPDDQQRWEGFQDKDVRRNFIQKVYGILSVQLIFTFLFTALFYFNEGLKSFVRENPWLVWVALGFQLVTMLTIVCCEGPRHQVPCNFILLALFTAAEAFLVGVICANYDLVSVLIAAGITAVCVILVSLFSCWTGFDFTKWGWVVFILLLGLAGVGLVMMVLGMFGIYIRALDIAYSCAGAAIMMFVLAYDTQLVVGGRSAELGPEEYILGALMLYIDIIRLFLFILRLVAMARGER